MGYNRTDTKMKRYAGMLSCALLLGASAAQLYAYNLPSPNAMQLPAPSKNTTLHSKFMSLRDAINLALRNNPDVLSAEMEQVTNKFALEDAYYHFAPKVTALGATAKYDQHGNSSTTIAPLSVTKNFNTGAAVTIAGYGGALDNRTGVFQATSSAEIKITQPLLKGAGIAYNTDGLKTAQEQDIIYKLQYRDNISTVAVAVITDYRALMQALAQQQLDNDSIKKQELTIKQQKILYDSGKKSYNDFLQIQQNLIDIKSSKIQNDLTLDTAYQNLFTVLGLDPNSKIKISTKPEHSAQKTPSLQACIKLAKKNNATYRNSVFGLAQAKRSLYNAKSERLWGLDLEADTNFGPGFGPGASTPTSSGVSGSSVSLGLTIPLDNRAADNSVTTSKITLIKDRRAVFDANLALESKIKTFFQSIDSYKQQLQQTKFKVSIDKRTLAGVKIKYRYGKVDVSDYTAQLTTLRTDEAALITQRIQLLNEITSLRQYLGLTLKQWGISLRQ